MVDKIIAALLCSLLLTPAVSAQIYTWTDKDGKVHYSDQPQSDDAQEIEVKEKNNIKRQVQKQSSTDWLAPAAATNKTASTNSAAPTVDPQAGPSCAWIRGELAKAKKDFNNKDQLTANLARRFAADYEMALKMKKCR